jgi:hypothetical protein
MSRQEVEVLYGTPSKVIPLKDKQVAEMFGEPQEHFLQINPQYLFSWVAVVFDANDRASAVYSDGFYIPEWKSEPVSDRDSQ